MWVCGSMKPGATTWPWASTMRLASPLTSPTAWITPSCTATAMTDLGDLLVVAPPARPGQHVVGRSRRGPDEPDEQAADFRDSDGNVAGAIGRPFFRAPMVNAANATRASVRCRYQPCQLP